MKIPVLVVFVRIVTLKYLTENSASATKSMSCVSSHTGLQKGGHRAAMLQTQPESHCANARARSSSAARRPAGARGGAHTAVFPEAGRSTTYLEATQAKPRRVQTSSQRRQRGHGSEELTLDKGFFLKQPPWEDVPTPLRGRHHESATRVQQ